MNVNRRAFRSASLLALAISVSALAQSADELVPGALVAEHVLEHSWSDGGWWRLVPSPHAVPRLFIRVGENYLVRAIRAPGKNVLVVWLPHAAGTETGSELAARLAANRGWSVVALVPPPDLPPPGAPIASWVSLAEERVRSAREALRLREARDDGSCIVLMGASVGGLAALRAAEIEPDVDAVVAMLTGASAEGFRGAALSYGASDEPIASDIARRLHALDPAPRASSLRQRRILLVSAWFDRVISEDSFDALRAAFSGAEVRAYPTGHETFTYAFPFAVDSALDWVGEACQRR